MQIVEVKKVRLQFEVSKFETLRQLRGIRTADRLSSLTFSCRRCRLVYKIFFYFANKKG